MIDKALLNEVFNHWFKDREVLHSQLQEMNAYTKEEDDSFVERTNNVKNLRDELLQYEFSNLEYDSNASTSNMSLDEAIAHAEDVSKRVGRQVGNNTFSCSMQHLQLANWLKELKELKSKYAYLFADFDNYKKRTSKVESNAYDKAFESALLEMLKTYDDLAYLVAELDKKCSAEKMLKATCDDPLQIGVRIIFKNLIKTLNDLGCIKIDCSYGDKFDVSIMEAISARDIKDDEGYDSGDVVEIYQTGWKYKDKVLRPVKVVTAK